jgi:hypothetical protein
MGTRWLLPIVQVEQGRLSALLLDRLFALGIAASPVHEARPSGTGLVARDTYCALTTTTLDTAGHLVWASLHELCPHKAIAPLQCDILNTCRQRFYHPVFDFDAPRQRDELEAWARGALEEQGVQPIGDPIPLAYPRYRRVSRWRTTSGDVYLKASKMTVPHERRAAAALAAAMPDYFVRSLAYRSARGWWLYRALAGEPLNTRPITSAIGARIGKTVAKLQRVSTEAPPIRAAFRGWRLSAWNLAEFVPVVARLVDQLTSVDAELAELHTHSAWVRASAACQDLSGLPSGFLHCDLCLTNIVATEQTMGLIDLEESYWGPVVLILWRLFESLQAEHSEDIIRDVVEAYVEVWDGAISATALQRAVSSLPITGRLYFIKAWYDRFGPETRRGSAVGTPFRCAPPPLRRLKGLLREIRDTATPASSEAPSRTRQEVFRKYL